MSGEKRAPGATAHTPLFNVPVKREISLITRPLSLTPDQPTNGNASNLQNVIVRKKVYNDLKDKNKDLEAQHRALSTSYSMEYQGNKELEAKNDELQRRIKDLEEQLWLERRRCLEYAGHELAVQQENMRLRELLGTGSGDAPVEGEEMV